jgi:hypothetical protein
LEELEEEELTLYTGRNLESTTKEVNLKQGSCMQRRANKRAHPELEKVEHQ